MLVALMTIMLLGGGGLEVFSKEQRKLAQEMIEDEDRASAVVGEMKSAQKSFNDTSKQIGKLIKSFKKIDSDHDAGRAELEPLLRQGDQVRVEAQKVLIDAIFEMRQQMTPEEWSAVYRASNEGE